jgi:hypothetical protein
MGRDANGFWGIFPVDRSFTLGAQARLFAEPLVYGPDVPAFLYFQTLVFAVDRRHYFFLLRCKRKYVRASGAETSTSEKKGVKATPSSTKTAHQQSRRPLPNL